MTKSKTSTTPAEASQAVQRVRVAMTGLAAVIMFIGLASAVFNYASHEPAVTAVGAAKPEVVANIADTAVSNTASEPLAELGIAPGPAATATGNASAAQ